MYSITVHFCILLGEFCRVLAICKQTMMMGLLAPTCTTIYNFEDVQGTGSLVGFDSIRLNSVDFGIFLDGKDKWITLKRTVNSPRGRIMTRDSSMDDECRRRF